MSSLKEKSETFLFIFLIVIFLFFSFLLSFLLSTIIPQYIYTTPNMRPVITILLYLAFIPRITSTPIPFPVPESNAVISSQEQSWFITRRLLHLPSTNINSFLDSVTKRHPHTIQVLVHNKRANNHHGTLHRRGVFDDSKWIKIGAAILITVSVLLGVGIASIAVFGFEWKKYFGKSSIKARQKAAEAAAAEENLIGVGSRQGQNPRIG
ncbi:hypothetical protein QBC38DRAFT_527981 [Podospora fimiseda]|uniref:Uncharacterized protein n=1 Tax=Podospora fimiseda TaxID=252190 RepID=A0AAN7BNU7_9PEZI|nr:hypothetical protein QBC38DRAFT_527981 [Podospora fimiseda]